MQSTNDKLAKMIPLLASDQQGEIAAAALGIGRVLKSAGKDWHWLASAISNSTSIHNVGAGAEVTALRVQLSMMHQSNGQLRAENNSLQDRLNKTTAALRRTEGALKAELEARKKRPWSDVKATPTYYDIVQDLITNAPLSADNKLFLERIASYLLRAGNKLPNNQAERVLDLWEKHEAYCKLKLSDLVEANSVC